MSEPKLFICLYLDSDVDVKLATNLRESGYDCISARKIGNEALDDESQMVLAANEGRVLLTHNIRHFVPIFERWWHTIGITLALSFRSKFLSVNSNGASRACLTQSMLKVWKKTSAT